MATKSGSDPFAKLSGMGSSLDRLKKLKERGDRPPQSGGRLNFYKPKKGTTEVRILPAMEEGDAFYEPAGYHYINKKYVLCRKYMGEDENCPVCNYVNSLWKKYRELKEAGEDNSKVLAEINDIKSKPLFLVNAYIRSAEDDEDEDKVYVMQIGKTIKDDLVSLALDDKTGDITNPVEGRDIGIKRTGERLNTKYNIMPRDSSLLAGDPENPKKAVKLIEEILEKRKDLKEEIGNNYLSEGDVEKELKRYLDSFVGYTDDDEDEEELDSVPDDDDIEDEDVNDEETDDEDEDDDDDDGGADAIKAKIKKQLAAAKRKK